MLLCFFILAFYDFEIKNDCFDYLGNTIYMNTRSPLVFKSQLDSWYFIQFSASNKVNCREKLTKENGLILDTDSQITSHICLAFLSSENVSTLQSFYKEKRERIIIQQLEGHQKLHANNFGSQENSSNVYNYIARFHKSFTPPIELNGKLTKLSDEIYLYQVKNPKKNHLNEILSIPSLRSISPQPPTKLMNRWNSGFVQRNEWPGGYDIYEKYLSTTEVYSKGDLRVNRYFNDRDIDGTGQIITIADSGLDINSSYFADNSDKPFEYEKVDMSRRKVVYYTCFGNDHDSIDMHGTHIAGIAAGSAEKGEMTDFEHQKFSLYNGVAPGAKISILDITEKDDSGTNVLNLPSILLGEAMGKAKSKIALCGWGNPSNAEQSYYYDMLAEFNPSRLFVFPVGNRGPGIQTVTTPGDGKNVLTVGALDSIWTSQYESKREYVLTNSSSLSKEEEEEEEEYVLNLTNYGRDLFYSQTEKGKFMIENAQVVTSLPSDVENKIVFITTSPDFCSLLDQEETSIAAAVFVGETYNESLCPTERKFDFPIFLSNDTEILSYKTVTIKVSLPDDGDQETTILSVAYYSSRGPNFVGIQKPDVVAPGTSIYSSDSEFVSSSSGTSNAAAYVAGVAALVYEYFERGFYPTGSEILENKFLPTSDLVRAVIIASAEPLTSANETQLEEEKGRLRGDRTPNSLSGHGVVNLASFVSFKPNMKVFNKIQVGDYQHFLMKFKITADQIKNQEKHDLRIAFAYKDPSSTNNYHALQSNIDMYIILPNGTIVFGNHRPEENEERFSTVQRILIYNEELLQMASTTNEDVFELHFVTGGGFSNHQRSGLFSLVISGPFVNEDTSSEEATTLHDSLTFPLIEIEEEPIKYFKFYASLRTECEFPQYGVLCQHNATEIGVNKTSFNIYSSTAKIVYINLPMNYTKIVLHLQRKPTITGRLAIQFAIDKADEYGSGYPFIVSLTGASSAVALSRSMFGPNKFVGMRISNMLGIDLNVTSWITYDTAIPQKTPTTTPAATIPKDVILHFSLSYGLFGLFLIPTIVFLVLLCVVTNKIKKNREIRKARKSAASTDNVSNDLTNELLTNNPL